MKIKKIIMKTKSSKKTWAQKINNNKIKPNNSNSKPILVQFNKITKKTMKTRKIMFKVMKMEKKTKIVPLNV